MAVDSRNDTGLSNCRTGWNLKVGATFIRLGLWACALKAHGAKKPCRSKLHGNAPARCASPLKRPSALKRRPRKRASLTRNMPAAIARAGRTARLPWGRHVEISQAQDRETKTCQ